MAAQLHCVIHPKDQKQYYTLRDDGVLALYQTGQREPIKEYDAVKELLFYEEYENVIVTDEEGGQTHTRKPNSVLPYEKSYSMEVVWPWLSVFEQYGTNGCVYQLETGAAKVFRRENYHADVSSFSNGLFICQGQVCLLHQTQWNRLDITNLESGICLTHREIYYHILDERNAQGGKAVEKKNYVDYFHGKVFFSPDYRYFLDTGWVWQPVGVPVLYCVEDFLTDYENSEIRLGIGNDWVYGDDWDQSAVWLDNHSFLLNFYPDTDLMEENELLSKNAQGFLLEFHVDDLVFTPTVYPKRELPVKKILPFPFVPTPVQSFHSIQGTDVPYAVKMLNVDLYWDEQEQLLLGIDGNEVSVLDKGSGVSYCMRYGTGCCFYSMAHHVVYQLGHWPGNFHYATMRGLLKLARGFHLALPEFPQTGKDE